MKIASFDVGIRNLAFCIMDYDPSRQDGAQYVLHSMMDLDILQDNLPDAPKCAAVIKSGKNKGNTCGNKATIIDDGGVYYCSRHKSSTSKFKAVKKSKVHTKNVSIQQLCVSLIVSLKRYPMLLTVDAVLIETQPKFASARIKSVSFMLYSYFIIDGLMNDRCPIQKVQFISARNKLKVYTGPPIYIPNCRTRYDMRKKLSVAYTKYMIRNNPEYVNIFESFKKKDDVADAFLQGVWYINRHSNKVTNQYNKYVITDTPIVIQEEDENVNNNKIELKQIINTKTESTLESRRLYNVLMDNMSAKFDLDDYQSDDASEDLSDESDTPNVDNNCTNHTKRVVLKIVSNS